MTGLRKSSSRSCRLLARATLIFSLTSSCFATGFYGPTVYLDEGGRRVTGSPEFYWELEVKRLAHDFHAPEKLFLAPRTTNDEGVIELQSFAQLTAEADNEDFGDAIDHAEIKPSDAAQAKEQNGAARVAIADPNSTGWPNEFDSEFADYHRGAFAFSRGQEHWEEAKQAWEHLLARPPNERHYRSVWAAFMLGKLALKKLDFPSATEWFQRTRQLAHDGFNDSLGMAADSYGWEARGELKQGHYDKAAPLYLTQLSLGDEGAVISLKALIPDREPVEGMLNYGPEAEEMQSWDDATKRAFEEKQLAALKTAARNPLLRRLVTVHILATQSDPFLYEDTGRPAVRRSARWLAAIQEAKIGKVDDAEYLGWVAYGDGRYDQAARWLSLSNGETPAALWLKSKLQLRTGKIADATQTMAKAWETLRSANAYTGWKTADEETSENEDFMSGHWSFSDSASGDLGGLRLARSEFVASLDAFVRAKMWNDAAFIAERVLTTPELKKYVDALPLNESEKMRYLLGRRLVREDRYDEARPYLPAKYQQRLDEYVKALNDGAATIASKEQRARAWFKAAWIARYNGMELMGTEGAPDGFISEGSFPEPDLAQERLTGTYVKTTYDANGERQQRVPISLKPSSSEKDRLTKNKIRPDVRFHYRVIAAALAVRAAELLPDESEELADVLNYAGRWAGERDLKLADRCFKMLRYRAGKTPIGSAAVAKHWFVDQDGPWSKEENAARPQKTPNEQ